MGRSIAREPELDLAASPKLAHQGEDLGARRSLSRGLRTPAIRYAASVGAPLHSGRSPSRGTGRREWSGTKTRIVPEDKRELDQVPTG